MGYGNYSLGLYKSTFDKNKLLNLISENNNT